MCVVAVAMAMAPWITVSELRREPDCGVGGASSRESRLPPVAAAAAAAVASAAVGPCEKALHFEYYFVAQCKCKQGWVGS